LDLYLLVTSRATWNESVKVSLFMATIGVAVSTFVAATLDLFACSRAWCLVFGARVSATEGLAPLEG
jgi:hypothetical protein